MPENQDPNKNPFGNLPEIMRSLADAFEGKTTTSKDDPYGIEQAISTIKSNLNKSAHTISADDIANSKKMLDLGDMFLDQVIPFDRAHSDYLIQTPLEWFNSVIEKLKIIIVQSAENNEKSLKESLKNLKNSAEGELPEQSLTIGPFGAIGSGNFASALYKSSFTKSVNSLLQNLSSCVLSNTDFGYLFNNAPGIVYPNLKRFENIEKIDDQNTILLTVCLLELARFRLLNANAWIYKQQIASMKELSGANIITQNNISNMMENMDPHDPMTGNMNMDMSEKAQENMEQIINEKQNNPLFINFVHLTLLVEGWVANTVLSLKNIPDVSNIYKLLLKRKENPINNIVGFVSSIPWKINKNIDKYTNFWKNAYKNLDAQKVATFWSHPDFLPTVNDVNNPDKFFESQNSELDSNLDIF
jgi:uncharacterized protein (DUF2342 family)